MSLLRWGLRAVHVPYFGRDLLYMSLVWGLKVLVSSPCFWCWSKVDMNLATPGEFWWLTWASFIVTKLPVRYSPRMVMIVRELSQKCWTKFRFRMNCSGIILSCPDHISNPQVSSSSLSHIKSGVLFHKSAD